MNQIARTFILIGLIVAILLALHFLPKLYLGETELRRVNLLSDILPEVHEDDLEVIPVVPEVPQPAVAIAVPASVPGQDSTKASRTDRETVDPSLPPMPMPDSSAAARRGHGFLSSACGLSCRVSSRSQGL